MSIKGNIHEKLASFNEHWSPKVIAELNGQHVRAAKLLGEFEWHSHQNEDEMFLIIKGALKIHFKDKTEELSAGDFIVIPKGIDHKPEAVEEVEVLLFEPVETINTGSNESDRMKTELEKI